MPAAGEVADLLWLARFQRNRVDLAAPEEVGVLYLRRSTGRPPGDRPGEAKALVLAAVQVGRHQRLLGRQGRQPGRGERLRGPDLDRHAAQADAVRLEVIRAPEQ